MDGTILEKITLVQGLHIKRVNKGMMEKHLKKFIQLSVLIFLVSLLFTSCKIENVSEDRGELLAEAGDRKLFEKDISFLFNGPKSAADSTRLIKSFINSWLRDQIMTIEAEKTANQDANIDRLVQNYRDALIRMDYEQNLVSNNLDTLILKNQIEAFYENNQEQFLSSSMLIRSRFVSFDASRSNIWPLRNEVFKTDISDRDLEEIVELNEGEWLANPYIWYNFQEFNNLTDNQLNRNNIIPGFEFSYTVEGQRYFIKVLNVVNEGEIMPIEIVEDKIRQLILLERRNQKISEIRNELFERNIRNQQIKIHYQ
ncbi:MAG: hypothetical protein EA362_02205 [Saprospirales bacterium]|nr:MAG: hypothetical protein EA362_02205 [Saprospirales bacterium]